MQENIPDDACQGKKVVVVGGGSVGLDVIEYFAPRGAECTIIDMLPQIGMLAIRSPKFHA